MKFKSVLISAVSVMALAGLMTPSVAEAAKVPCSTAKLIVPWKAGGGNFVEGAFRRYTRYAE